MLSIGYDCRAKSAPRNSARRQSTNRAGVWPLVKADHSVSKKAIRSSPAKISADSRSRVLLECLTVSDAASPYAEVSIRDCNARLYLSGKEQILLDDHAMLVVYPAREVVVMVASDIERRSYPKIPARNWFDLRRRVQAGAPERDNC